MKLLFTKKIKTKKEGTILLIALFLSTLIIVTGSGLATLLLKEIQFSSDFLFAERSYYAAESGVEKALFSLKSLPIQNIVNEVVLVGTAKTNLNIKNSVDKFSVELAPNEIMKLRLKIDEDNSFNQSIRAVSLKNLLFNFQDYTANKLQWKILCQQSGEPVSLQNILNFSSPTFKNFRGIKETVSANVPNVSVETFWDSLAETEKQSCFLSLQNLDENDVFKFNIEVIDNLPPAVATITSHGKSGSREKIIKFDYKQNNLASFFDFGFFHSDDGI